MTETPKRVWWRKKRWWMTLALTFAIAYPVGEGPLVYAFRRGWVGRDVWSAYRKPPGAAVKTIYPFPGVGEPLYGLQMRWIGWWTTLADRHHAASLRPVPEGREP